MDNKELFLAAKNARKNAFAPFSDFQVGAALLTKSGKVYTGVNVENSSYGAAICAERTAFVKAISEGEREFEAIAIAGGKGADLSEETWPCGICRQFMYEFGQELRVITGKSEDELEEVELNRLLPRGFGLQIGEERE